MVRKGGAGAAAARLALVLLMTVTLVRSCHAEGGGASLHLAVIRVEGSSVHFSMEIRGARLLAFSCDDCELVRRGESGFSGDFGGVFSANISVVLGELENDTVEFEIWKSGGRLSVEVVAPGENGTVLGVRDFQSPGEMEGKIRIPAPAMDSETSIERERPGGRMLIFYSADGLSPPRAAPGAVDGVAVRSPVTGGEGTTAPVVPVVFPESDQPQDIASAVVSASADVVSLGGLKLAGRDVIFLVYSPEIGPAIYGEAADLLRSGGWPLAILLWSDGEVPPVGLLRNFDGLVYLPGDPGGYREGATALAAASAVEGRTMAWVPVVPQGAGPWVDSAMGTDPDWLVANLSSGSPLSWQLESLASRLKGCSYGVNLTASVIPEGWVIPGKPARVNLTVTNVGNGTAAELSAWVEGSGEVEVVGGVPIQVDSLGPGESASGIFSLSLSEGENNLSIEASYLDPTGVERRVEVGPISVEVPAPSTLRVEVVGALGQPIPGAEISITDLSGESEVGVTGPDGSWTIEVPEGAYEVRVGVGREVESDDVILRGGSVRTLRFRFDLVAYLGGYRVGSAHLIAAASALAVGGYASVLVRRRRGREERVGGGSRRPRGAAGRGGRGGEARRRRATPRLGGVGEPGRR